ncbi:unnamed protein product [Rhodiola kirilowii]
MKYSLTKYSFVAKAPISLFLFCRSDAITAASGSPIVPIIFLNDSGHSAESDLQSSQNKSKSSKSSSHQKYNIHESNSNALRTENPAPLFHHLLSQLPSLIESNRTRLRNPSKFQILISPSNSLSETFMSCSSPISCIPDWDQPFTDEDLQQIDEIVSSVTASAKLNKRISTESDDENSRDVRRRLPPSLICPNYKSPSEEMKLRYPFLKFEGQIVYSRTAEEVDTAAMQLLKFVERKSREVGQVILGFDIEWRPSFRRGISPGKVAVMQICGDSHHCYVMHIFHSGVPRNLRILLEDPASTKVGVGIGNDSVKLFKDYSISTKDVQDLSNLANRKLGGELKMWSLRSLIEELMHKQLEKPSAVQLGNWEARYLSKPQLHYAALDAYASWSVHQVLDSLPDAPGYDNAEELDVSS